MRDIFGNKDRSKADRSIDRRYVESMETMGLCGSWSLVEFANFTADAIEIPWTGNLSGRLIYAPSGIVSVAINRSKRGADGGAKEHNSFYCGKFRLLSAESIEHVVEQSSESRRIGDRYVRTFKLNGDVLELCGIGLTGMVKLVWRRD